jgi:hypothetical protein
MPIFKVEKTAKALSCYLKFVQGTISYCCVAQGAKASSARVVRVASSARVALAISVFYFGN